MYPPLGPQYWVDQQTKAYRPCHHFDTDVEGKHRKYPTKSLTNPRSTSPAQMFPRKRCIAPDICMLHSSDTRVCLSCLGQCIKKWSRLAGEISAPSSSPYNGITLFAHVNHSELLLGAGLPTLESRRECAIAILGHQLFTRKVPSHLEKVNMPKRTTTYGLRWHQTTFIPTAHTSAYRDSVILKSLHTFHSLPKSLQEITSHHIIKNAAIKHLESHVCTCWSRPLSH